MYLPADQKLDIMKTIKLKKLSILNFKGIRSLEIDFSGKDTNILGANGTGKSTIADAFNWVLFGKDIFDREKFDYKTLDNQGNIIPKLPHEVTAILDIDDKEVRITRKVTEKWDRKKSGKEEVFNGNNFERFYNDVPCTEAEFNSKISEICPETTFKYITNPLYFNSQKAEIQKKMLMDMAGEISDSELAKGNKEFEEYLKAIEGKSQDEFKKELNAKKNRIKSEMEGIPDRVDENKRKLAQEEDWEDIERQLKLKTGELENIEQKIFDIGKRNEEADKAIQSKYQEINELRQKISLKEMALQRQNIEANEKAFEEWNKLKYSLDSHYKTLESLNQMLTIKRQEEEKLSQTREKLIAEYRAIKAEINEISNRSLQFSDNDFRCPTCLRVLEEEDIEIKKSELERNFNNKKSSDLKNAKERLDANLSEGTELKNHRLEVENHIKEIEGKINETHSEIDSILNNPIYINEPKRKVEPFNWQSDEELNTWNGKIQDLLNEVSKGMEKPDTSLLQSERKKLVFEIDGLKITLSKREQIQKDKERIEELEKQYSLLSDEYDELSHQEYIMEEFSKRKNEEIQKRIDNLFKVVKFRWIALQINGKEKETCEATVNGVPYSVLNSAGKINAGLDIINAICKKQQISAPIIIDNAESCNSFLETEGQKILLNVTNDKQLVINQ